MHHELLDNKKEIEKMGWKYDELCMFNRNPLCDTYTWKPKPTIGNAPILAIYYHNRRKYLNIVICKFQGQNSFYGKMETVFRGKCKSIAQLKQICKLLELDNYKKM